MWVLNLIFRINSIWTCHRLYRPDHFNNLNRSATNISFLEKLQHKFLLCIMAKKNNPFEHVFLVILGDVGVQFFVPTWCVSNPQSKEKSYKHYRLHCKLFEIYEFPKPRNYFSCLRGRSIFLFWICKYFILLASPFNSKFISAYALNYQVLIFWKTLM